MNKELLDLYTDYLLSSFSQTTATGLSRMVDGAITHDRVTNFLAESSLTSKDLWLLVKKDVRQVETEDAAIIFDDTVEEKPYTDENEIICYHYDHTQGRSVKGINLLNCLYHSQNVRLPLSFEIVRKEETFLDSKSGKHKRRSLVSKNELMRSMLLTVRQNHVRYRYVLTDIWFASCDNMSFIKQELNKEFMMAIKANRQLALSVEDKQHGRWQRIDALQFRADEVCSVYLKGLDFPVLLMKHLFTNKDGSEGILYLVCSDLTLSSSSLLAIYQKRWSVEEFHKSIKSNTGLAKSPTRIARTQSNHFFAAIYAFVKLERLKIKNQLNHFALKGKLYLNALKASFAELHRLQTAMA